MSSLTASVLLGIFITVINNLSFITLFLLSNYHILNKTLLLTWSRTCRLQLTSPCKIHYHISVARKHWQMAEEPFKLRWKSLREHCNEILLLKFALEMATILDKWILIAPPDSELNKKFKLIWRRVQLLYKNLPRCYHPVFSTQYCCFCHFICFTCIGEY